jgi:hypothetical protein
LTRLILASVVIGLALLGVGIVRRMNGNVPRWQSGAMIAAGLLLQSWWVLLLALFLVKTVIFHEDT